MDAQLLPQHPSDERVEIDSVEWLFEPDWPGRRLIARVAEGTASLTDAAAAPVDAPEAAGAISRAARSASAIVDGVWTSHGIGDEGSAFVAFDLLWLDREPLLDVPFQERRRLLASVLEPGALVRVGTLVKQPLAGWLAGWREAGFTHYLAWHQNARYRPGERTDDWLRIPLDAGSAPGFLRRVIGVRAPRTRRIR